MSSDICQIRLDFEAFIIAGPANSVEQIAGTTTETHCVNDFMTLVQTGGAAMPTICGALTGEHLYVDLGMVATDTSVMTIQTAVSTAIGPTTANRLWDIKMSQIECYAAYRAPAGCHRYFTSDVGKVISLNFMRVTGTVPIVQATAAGQNTGLELGTQIINTCIRRTKGMCCVQYQVCQSYNGIALTSSTGNVGSDAGWKGTFVESFSIDIALSPFLLDGTQNNVGMVDSQCSGDYIEIPSSWSGACGAQSAARPTVNSRYCGARLGANFHASAAIAINSGHSPVCDCSEPFLVRHSSDAANDIGGRNQINIANMAIAAVYPRGFCLDFTQMPCYF